MHSYHVLWEAIYTRGCLRTKTESDDINCKISVDCNGRQSAIYRLRTLNSQSVSCESPEGKDAWKVGVVRCETTVSNTSVSWHPELAPSGYSSYHDKPTKWVQVHLLLSKSQKVNCHLYFAAWTGCMVWWHWLNWQRHLWQLNSVTVWSSNPVLY